MQEIVINNCYGGFSVSRKALHRLRELGNTHAINEIDVGEAWPDGSGVRDFDSGFCREIARDDTQLIQVIKELKQEAGGFAASLKVIKVPDGVEWVIEQYDGIEWVAEKHRTWG